MPTATFRGAKITTFHGVPKEGVRLLRVNIEADYTDTLRDSLKKLEWVPIPPTTDYMGLKGQLSGGESFTFTPGNGLHEHEISSQPFVIANKFEAVRINDAKKKTTKDVIRFQILMNNREAGSQIDEFVWSVGDVLGVLKIKFAEQTKIEETEEDDEKPTQRSLVEIDKGPAPAKKRAKVDVQ